MTVLIFAYLTGADIKKNSASCHKTIKFFIYIYLYKNVILYSSVSVISIKMPVMIYY